MYLHVPHTMHELAVKIKWTLRKKIHWNYIYNVVFSSAVWAIAQKKILFRCHPSHFIPRKLNYIQTRLFIWVLILKRFIECDYGWCFLSQWFIIKYLDEACFLVSDEGKEDCLWFERVAILESCSVRVFFLYVVKICLCYITYPNSDLWFLSF